MNGHILVLSPADRVRLQVIEGDGADNGSGETVEPAHHGHEHELARERPVQHVRRGEPVERRPQHPGDPGEHPREDEREPPGPADADADRLRPHLVVADGLQGLAEGGLHDPPHQRGADGKDGQDIVVVAVRQKDDLVIRRAEDAAQQHGRGDADPVGPAGDPEQLQRQAPADLRQRQGQDRKKDLRVADADEAEDHGDQQPGQHPTGQERLHGRQMQVLDDERGRVGRSAKIDGVAE